MEIKLFQQKYLLFMVRIQKEKFKKSTNLKLLRTFMTFLKGTLKNLDPYQAIMFLAFLLFRSKEITQSNNFVSKLLYK